MQATGFTTLLTLRPEPKEDDSSPASYRVCDLIACPEKAARRVNEVFVGKGDNLITQPIQVRELTQESLERLKTTQRPELSHYQTLRDRAVEDVDEYLAPCRSLPQAKISWNDAVNSLAVPDFTQPTSDAWVVYRSTSFAEFHAWGEPRQLSEGEPQLVTEDSPPALVLTGEEGAVTEAIQVLQSSLKGAYTHLVYERIHVINLVEDPERLLRIEEAFSAYARPSKL